MIISQWHVPIDDTHCWWYAMFTTYSAPLDQDEMRRQRLKLYSLPDYKPRINKINDYGFNPDQQRTLTYTGMGADINVHDQWAVESQGLVHDRTTENLGVSDLAIAAYRRFLIGAIESVRRGEPAPKNGDATSGETPLAVDAVVARHNWQDAWRAIEAARRAGSVWAGS